MAHTQDLNVPSFSLSVPTGPRNVYVHRYPGKYDGKRVVFDVRAPGNLLLDREVYVKYTLNLLGPGGTTDPGFMFEGSALPTANDAFASAYSRIDTHVAPRQGWTLHHAIRQSTLKLNEETVTQQPDVLAGVLARFYASQRELETVCTLSGGELNSGSHDFFHPGRVQIIGTFDGDDGFHNVRIVNHGFSVGVNANPASLNAFGTPVCRQWVNDGLGKRLCRLSQVARGQSDPFTANSTPALTRYGVGNGQLIIVELRDRLPMSPFVTWEHRDGGGSIPNIARMEVAFDLPEPSKLIRNLFYGVDSADITSLDWTLDIDELERVCKWITPPVGTRIQCENTVKMIHYDVFQRSLLDADTESLVLPADEAESNVVTFTWDDLHIANWPQKMFIFVRPVRQDVQLPAEHHLTITQLDIDVNGHSGKLQSFQSEDLFVMYVNNAPSSRSMHHEFREWRDSYCCAVLTQNEIGTGDNKQKGGRMISFKIGLQERHRRPGLGSTLPFDYTPITSGAAVGGYKVVIACEQHFSMTVNKRRSEFHRFGPR